MDDTIFELGKVFRSVTRLVREKTEDIFGNVTPLEKALREVTDEDSSMVSNSLLRDIARATNEATVYQTVMQTVWQGINAEPFQWRKMFKSLRLLEFMLLFGPERVKDDCVNVQAFLKNLSAFRYHDGQMDRGGAVRQHSSRILELIENPDKLSEAKHQAIVDSEKCVGISNPADPQLFMNRSNTNYSSPSTGGFGGFVAGSNPFFSGPSAVPPQTWVVPGRNSYGNRFGCNEFTPSVSTNAPAPQTCASSFEKRSLSNKGNPFDSIDKFQSKTEAANTWNCENKFDPVTSDFWPDKKLPRKEEEWKIDTEALWDDNKSNKSKNQIELNEGMKTMTGTNNSRNFIDFSDTEDAPQVQSKPAATHGLPDLLDL